MTNFEKYANTIINICNQDSTEVAIAMDIGTGVLRRCSEVGCKYCKFSSRFNDDQRCEVNLVRWLLSEYQESAPKLTKKERAFCEIIKGATIAYIARDKDGTLCIYGGCPYQDISTWITSCWIEIDTNLFQFITWESGKAWSMEELLKLEVEE